MTEAIPGFDEFPVKDFVASILKRRAFSRNRLNPEIGMVKFMQVNLWKMEHIGQASKPRH